MTNEFHWLYLPKMDYSGEIITLQMGSILKKTYLFWDKY